MLEKYQYIFKLENWIAKNGFDGYDPFDLMDWILNYLGNSPDKFLNKIRNKLLLELEKIAPILIRKILNIKPKKNAKAIGLLFTSYVNLFYVVKNKIYLERANLCKKWLLENYSKRYKGMSWGYPFDWQSKKLIPKYTPSGVVTAIVGDGFWTDYKLLGNSKSLEVCKQICEFFLRGLNIQKFDADKICFSYTPIDDFQVHNANLFVAEFLIRIGKEINNSNYISYGKMATNFSISQQNKNGSIFYWGKNQNHYNPSYLDHYHTGFEIRNLYSIAKSTQEKKYQMAFEKYYSFYKKIFFTKTGFPKFSPTNLYPLDIHTCAESILCNCIFKNKSRKKFVENLIIQINNKMLTQQGWYIYRIEKICGLKIKTRIPYLRWGQSWMLRALTEYLLTV